MKRKNPGLKSRKSTSGQDLRSNIGDVFRKENDPFEESKTKIVSKKRKLSKEDLFKPPSNEELNQLRETENLFHSNLFRLQIEEMFTEIKIKDRYATMFKDWFQSMSTFLNEIENSEPQEISCSKWLKKLKVKSPLDKCSSKMKGIFLFVKPTAMKIIGSYGSGCCVGPNANVDVLLQMPQRCFHRNDSLNHKYFYKRALYLTYLAAKLKNSNLVEGMKFSQSQGIPMRPVLELKPAGKLGKHFSVTVHVVPPSTCFKHHIFSPLKNNVREKWYFDEENVKEDDGGPPTPHYNSYILMDLAVNENEEIRCNALVNSQNIKDGIKLLKIWLHQRELDEGFGSFSAYIMSMYVVYLMQERRISNLMSSYQVVRTAWNFLAVSDWTTKGISLAESLKTTNSIPLEVFHQQFDVVFVDASGYNNLCANMSKSVFMRVKHECQVAVKCLDNPNLNSFQTLFMTKIPFYRQFDHVITFYNPSTLENVTAEYSKREERLDFGSHHLPLISKILLTKVKKATERRAKLVAEKLCPPAKWDVSAKPSHSPQTLVLGLTLDLEHAYDVIEKGPPANTVEAQEFREFWGDKSELRRFQDGSVCEAVLWADSDAKISQRRMICKLAISHILKSIGLEEGNSWQYFADQLENLVKRVGATHSSVEEDCLAVIRSTDLLSSNLRQLKGLPLDITSVAGLSPAHRYADPFSPFELSSCSLKKGKELNHYHLIDGVKPHAAPWLPHVNVIIQLGVSSKWPGSLDAIRRVKAAFHLEIAKSLEEQCKLKAEAYPEFLDVLQDGFVFRVHVACPREISLLKEFKEAGGMVKYKDTEESIALEKKIVHLPKLSNALHGLQQCHGAYGSTCCLAKRWVASQLLLSDQHLPEICVELLVASLFLIPEPLTAPNQPQVALLRFLNLLTTRDWSSQPLILNFNEEMSRQDILAVENKFGSTERTSLPPLVILTPYDQTGDTWTKGSPSVQVLIRLAHLAANALQVIEAKLLQKTLTFKQVFRPSLEPYDLILHLYPQMVPRILESVDPFLSEKKENSELPQMETVAVKGNLPVVSFDPVELYIAELRESYSEYALFFNDCYGGNFIGVLWKPTAYEEKDIKVSHLSCRKLDPRKNKLVLNFDAIIEDFYVIGKGLVSNITMKLKTEAESKY